MPGPHLSEEIRQILDRARRTRLLPPSSLVPSMPSDDQSVSLFTTGSADATHGGEVVSQPEMTFEDLEQIFNGYDYISERYVGGDCGVGVR